MAKFKVGDLIKGKTSADKKYTITTSYMTSAEVIEVFGNGMIQINILKHELGCGGKFNVNADYFSKLSPTKLPKKLVGKKSTPKGKNGKKATPKTKTGKK